MARLFVVLLLAVGGYYLYTEGLPRWQQKRQAEDTATAEAEQSALCLSRASLVHYDFTGGVLVYGHPDTAPSIWGTVLVDIYGKLSAADGACGCSTDTCVKAALAMGRIRRLVGRLDGWVRGKATSFADPASDLEEIDRLLKEARAAAG